MTLNTRNIVFALLFSIPLISTGCGTNPPTSESALESAPDPESLPESSPKPTPTTKPAPKPAQSPPSTVAEKGQIVALPAPTEQDTAENSVSIDDLIVEPTYSVTIKQEVADTDATVEARATEAEPELARELCKQIGAKLSSVSEEDCIGHKLVKSGATSIEGRDLAIKDYLPTEERDPLGRVLVIGGIHGDEFSSVSVLFKWMDILDKHHSGLFHWRFAPSSNPDGLLRRVSQRQNANGVDLNRNFPTKDWESLALDYWHNEAGRQPRRYPGTEPVSEPETQWIVQQIETFKPDVIISMHAPYHLVDYDGPPRAPSQLGSLYLRRLGVFPGSLGNYAGVDLGLPIVTVELASAGIMPTETEISDMWEDLISWLINKLSE